MFPHEPSLIQTPSRPPRLRRAAAVTGPCNNNGICEASKQENSATCPGDCTAVCGDKTCDVWWVPAWAWAWCHRRKRQL